MPTRIDTDLSHFYLEDELLHFEACVNPLRTSLTYSLLSICSVVFLLILVYLFPSLHDGFSDRKNLVLITIDTLRADRLGVYGSNVSTPAIDSLASEGILYENAFCQVPITLPSHATILTGMYPFKHGIRHNGRFRLKSEATTIAEVLKGEGYHTSAFIGAYVLDSKYGLDQGFDLYDDEMSGELYPGLRVFVNRRAEIVTQKAVDWLSRVKEPFFIWVHYFDPHKPYDPPSPFREIYDDPYDGEVAYVDVQVGKLLSAVREDHLERRTLIVLTSDHGESLGEHGELTHSIFLYSATTRVPLIMTLPGIIASGVRDTTMVQLIDLMPTVLSALEINISPAFKGRNLLDSSETPAGPLGGYAYSETWAPRLQYGWSEIRSIRNERYLYVRAPRPELYDLTDDPEENRNIYSEMSDFQIRLVSVLDSLEESINDVEMSERVEMGKDESDILESLGYVFKSSTSRGGGADPKDMIGLHREILLGWKLLTGGEYEKALNVFEKVLRSDEDDPDVCLGIGLCYDGLGRDSLSLNYLQRAIELDPMEERSYYAASNVLTRAGRFSEATEMLYALAAIYPKDPIVRLKLAKAHSRSGDYKKAQEAYLAAIGLDRNNCWSYLDYGRFLALRERYREALEKLEMALRIDGQCSQAYSLMGASYAKIGQLWKAVDSFQASLKIDSTQTAVWVDLGKVLTELGRIGEAHDAFERALSLDPEYEPAKKALQEFTAGGGVG